MPTAGRLFGAVCFGILFYYVSGLVKPLLPEGMATGLLSPINAVIGFLMGWRMIGTRAGDGFVPATGYGITTAAAAIFWCLFVWGGHQMYQNAIKMRYAGPVQALQDMVVIMLDYGRLLLDPSVLIALAVGTLIATWITEFFGARWS